MPIHNVKRQIFNARCTQPTKFIQPNQRIGAITLLFSYAVTADLDLRWTNIASMDIASLLNTMPAPSRQSDNGSNIVTQLQSSGLDARVIRVDKSGVLLATRLGEILGKNALDLKKGDLVRIRLDTGDKNPVLKVGKPSVEPILLNGANHKALYQALKANQAFTGVVIRHRPGNSIIQVGNSQYPITHQAALKTGQLVNIELRQQINAIELKPVNSEQVLKSALAKLLPQQSNLETRTALSQLVKILRSGDTATPRSNDSATPRQAPVASSSPTETRKSAIVENKVATMANPVKAVTGNLTTSDKVLLPLAARLGTLLDSIPSIAAISSRVIQQWISHSGLIKMIDTNTASTPQNPLSVLQQLPVSEDSLKLLIQLLFRSRADLTANTDKSRIDPEAVRSDQSAGLIKEILKLIDQSLNQQLFHKVTARHQQELQQPIAVNLTIPFSDKETVNDLHLKIRQKDREACDEKQCWDIHLSFEFGNLGLISSHINMDGNLVSTSFWSVLAETKQKIDLAIPEFKQQLSNSGFKTGQFNSFSGIPSQDDMLDMAPYPDALLDIKV